jgi:hypothetical protein
VRFIPVFKYTKGETTQFLVLVAIQANSMGLHFNIFYGNILLSALCFMPARIFKMKLMLKNGSLCAELMTHIGL